MSEENKTLIPAETRVMTTQPAIPESAWSQNAKRLRKWGVQGTVKSHRYNTSSVPYYLIEHDDGTIGWYDSPELKILEPTGRSTSDGIVPSESTQHVGPGFADVVAHATDPKTGAIDLRKMEQLEGRFGSNGGRGCDVRRGPCSCGAWH